MVATGISTIGNVQPELPLQAIEEFLSTEQFNLVYSFGADLHYAEAHAGKTTRLSRWDPLSTDGGQLDGTGIDPAPEVPVRTDIDAEMEVFAKSVAVNEQLQLFQNERTMTKFMALLGQWMRNKEDLLMRDLYASSPAYINATGGLNADQPSEITRSAVNNVERVLLGSNARTFLSSLEATDQFGTAGVRDAFIALASTDITPDLQNVDGVQLKINYPGNQDNLKPEEYCSIGRFRFFTTSEGIVEQNASLNGNDIYKVPMFGLESVAKIEQNTYSANVGYRPAWVVSRVAQNAELYAKFACARAITNQNWLSGLNCTQRL